MRTDIPGVSIIIPFYNCEKYLEATVNSALDQTYENKEIILVNDGSTDGSQEIAKSFEQNGVRIIHQENKGAASARNTGFDVSTGTLIQYLDGDDLLSLTKIEAQVRLLATKPEKYVSSCSWGKFKHSITEAKFLPQAVWKEYEDPLIWLTDSWRGGGMMQTSCWLVPRALISDAGGWDERLSLHDDGEFFCRILLRCKGIAFDEKSQVFYRTGIAGSLSQTLSHKAITSAFMVYESYTNEVLRINNSYEVKYALMLNYARFIYLYDQRAPELVQKARNRILDLGYSRIPPFGGKSFKNLCKLIGFDNALLIRKIANKIKTLG